MTDYIMLASAEAANGHIFVLNSQLLFDILFQGLAVLILFTVVSYLLIEPVKKVISDRQAQIKADVENAASNREEAAKLKEEYDAKMLNVDKEADQILAEARRKALKNGDTIVEEARGEATRIVESAKKEAELEKLRVKDEVRVEMIQVASMMAEKIVEKQMDPAEQDKLIDQALKEMGDKTWLNK